jgi:hypothetical protein
MNFKSNQHLWLMLLCCLIPAVALGAIFLLNIPVSYVLLVGLFLVCPLLHLWMMKGMGHAHGHETRSDVPSTPVEDKRENIV